MTKEEVIEQLESLKNNSASFAVIEEPNSIWHRDIAALTIAINILKKDLQGVQSQKGHHENKTNLIISRKETK